MATYTGTSGADTLAETTFKGDTLVGRAGDDTYHCWASSWYDPGFPEYGIPGETVYYRTDIVEEPDRGYDTVYYHIGIPNIAVSGAELPSIERIHLVNELSGSVWTFQLLLGDGAHKVFGSTLGETISGGGGNDTLSGASGNDSLLGGNGADSLLGGTGRDTLDGGGGLDRLAGGSGDDEYYLQNAGDLVTEFAGAGTDTVHASADFTLAPNLENLVLGTGDIDGAGNAADNWIYAGTGDNVLSGGAGPDTASFKLGAAFGVNASLAAGVAGGGSGNDTLAGFQNLEGTLYADSLQGNGAANRLAGLSGNDTLDGGAGADALLGGFGDDRYHVDNSGDVVTEKSGEGTDTIFSTVSHTLRVHVEHLELEGAAHIQGTGNGANNALTGNTGNNVLSGGAGFDTLDGADGNDTLLGGSGSDQIRGGAGSDRFRFDSAAEASGDVILDFVSGTDRIDLSRIDADTGSAGDQAFDADELAYDPNEGMLYADIGGNGSFDFQVRLGLFLHPPTVLVADLIL